VIHTTCPGRPAFPVGKIVCVGRNWAEHAREMGAEPPAEPLLFLKPPTALSRSPAVLRLPRFAAEVHHEVEMVLRIAAGGEDLEPAEALALVDAMGVGLDLTARDLQRAAKERGHPWAVAKGWNGSAPLSALGPVRGPEDLDDRELVLEVNGSRRQRGTTRDMLFPPAALLAHVSSRFRLEPGDLIFTGTPPGVGAVAPGDHVVAKLDGRVALDLRVLEPRPGRP
jgi:2-keto-4-pentenoate hydratase/2-oxohepta-3-ene-1,7-dioic acid hydratase in catechol pathway